MAFSSLPLPRIVAQIRRWAVPVVAALAVTFAGSPARAQMVQEEGVAEVLLDPVEMARIEAAVDRGLEYLAQQQKPDGSWPAWSGGNNAINALCLLAFLGRGHVAGTGPYRQVVDRGVNFLLSTQNVQGLYVSTATSHGPMYEHALSTLSLIEAYGSVPSPQMRESVQKAIDLIVKSQSKLGGWRYQPVPSDADLSVTVLQVVALRAAMNARLNVPVETIENALKYVRSCASAGGGFSYTPGGSPSVAQSAAGTLCMQLLGAYDDPSVKNGLEYLAKVNYTTGLPYFYYTSYYAMQAHFQAGGDHWAQWQSKAKKILLDSQAADGSWPGFAEQQYSVPANCYATPFACMCLEVFMHYLPAYQR